MRALPALFRWIEVHSYQHPSPFLSHGEVHICFLVVLSGGDWGVCLCLPDVWGQRRLTEAVNVALRGITISHSSLRFAPR